MNKPFLLADNRFSAGIPTATATGTGFDVLSIIDQRSYTFWKAPAAGTFYLQAHAPASGNADTLAIVGHNLGTAAALVSLETWNGSTWTQRVAPFTPTSDRALVKLFTSVSALDWRLKIVTASISPQLAVLMVGIRLEFPFFFDSPLTPYDERVITDNTDGKTGNLLGVVVRYFPWEATYKATRISGTWYRGAYRQFWDSFGKLYRSFIFAPAIDSLSDDVIWCRMHKSATFKPVYQYSTEKIQTFEFKIEGVNLEL